jgi:hypothetical protein
VVICFYELQVLVLCRFFEWARVKFVELKCFTVMAGGLADFGVDWGVGEVLRWRWRAEWKSSHGDAVLGW